MGPPQIATQGPIESLIVGITMSDSSYKQGAWEKCSQQAPMPAGLKRIHVNFKKDERSLHSIQFQGETELHIGLNEKDDPTLIEKARKGRVETFELADDEQLLGAEWHHTTNCVFGLRWMKQKVPVRPPPCEGEEDDAVPELEEVKPEDTKQPSRSQRRYQKVMAKMGFKPETGIHSHG